MINFLRIFRLLPIFFVGSSCLAHEIQEISSDVSMMGFHSTLSNELIEMERLDQEARDQLIASKEKVWAKIEEIDNRHVAKLKSIVKEYGWPGFKLVGEKGAEAMWLLVQHTPDFNFQKECLLLLEGAVAKQDASPIHLAYLKDRVLIYDEKKQLYGTQLQFIDGQLNFYPIEEEDQVDHRRAAMGLCSLSEYKQHIIEDYGYPAD